ncbi:hypothetical protein BG011_005335 [Mortierella polycephala]|uniref:Uncharacterized protein n=1 Tax=Mortierella polycephala TaxID=41804 RepID=A0A9P6PY04_9FUNG|nr:hypothetical protein BG011_005335 [Mortierella polycephala]
MTVEEYWFKYNGSAKEYLEKQARSKTVANTAFLHAIGLADQKRKRGSSVISDDLWHQNKKNKEEREIGGKEQQAATTGIYSL